MHCYICQLQPLKHFQLAKWETCLSNTETWMMRETFVSYNYCTYFKTCFCIYLWNELLVMIWYSPCNWLSSGSHSVHFYLYVSLQFSISFSHQPHNVGLDEEKAVITLTSYISTFSQSSWNCNGSNKRHLSMSGAGYRGSGPIKSTTAAATASGRIKPAGWDSTSLGMSRHVYLEAKLLKKKTPHRAPNQVLINTTETFAAFGPYRIKSPLGGVYLTDCCPLVLSLHLLLPMGDNTLAQLASDQYLIDLCSTGATAAEC